MQSLFGKINFMRRFLSNFAKIVKPLQQMIDKDMQLKWTYVEKEYFEKVEASIVVSSCNTNRTILQIFIVSYICFRSFSCNNAHP
jgi:hypothetical protein